MSRHLLSLLLCVLLAGTGPVDALARQQAAPPPAPPAAAPADPLVILRSNTIAPNDAVVSYVAENAIVTTFTEAARPDLKSRAARQVIEELCGSVQPAYVENFRTRYAPRLPPNQSFDVEKVMGAAAYAYDWPACLYTTTRDTGVVDLVVGEKESKWKLANQAIGAPPNLNAVTQLFSGAGLNDSKPIPASTPVSVPYTLPVAVRPEGVEAAAFVRAVETKSAAEVQAEVAQPAGQVGATIDPAVANCVDAPTDPKRGPYPLDAAAITSAFDRASRSAARSASLDPVRVFVVDNGFFGVPPDGAPPWNDRFKDTLFDLDRYADLGPMVLVGQRIHPINYFNSAPYNQVNWRTGHGTHIAGLITGGDSFATMKPIYADPWLKLVIMNVSGGRDTFYDGVDQAILLLLVLAQDTAGNNTIVNMSIGVPPERSKSFVEQIRQASWARTLFITAAGNEYDPANPPTAGFPARLGGTPGHILTVGSIDASGLISAFSQRGRFVDMLAPGCKIKGPLSLDVSEAITGSSQATALVTMTATLLRRIWKAEPDQLKRRLVLSGRYLTTAATREQTAFHVELDTATALFVQEDVLRYRDGDRVRTVLGQLLRIKDINCAGAAEDWADIRAYKRAEDGGELFIGNALEGGLKLCTAVHGSTAAPAADVLFRVTAELDNGAITSRNDVAFTPIPAASLLEFVKREETASPYKETP